VACKKKNTPAHPCCGVNCANTCFRVTACGSNANGANVQVYATNATNSILASGNTASNGVVCLGLGNWSTWSLGASATFGSGNDYTTASTMLLGNPCGRSYTLPLTPATDAATNAEANGTVNISFDYCDGVTGWANANAEVKVSLSVINSGVTDANGNVSITVAADGTNSYYVRVYRPTDNAPLNSGTFLLAAGKCADAAMRLSHNATPCNPDTEAVVTVRDCADGLPGGQRICCASCAPDTLPRYLCFTDPEGRQFTPPPLGGGVAVCSDASVTDTLSYYPGIYWGYFLAGSGNASLLMKCEAGGIYLEKNMTVYCRESSAYGTDCYFGKRTLIPFPVPGGCTEAGFYVQRVLATSVTCDPFSATFDMPSQDFPGYYWSTTSGCVACGTKTVPAHTITVTEC
jgi:hypothetical protein